VTIKMVILSVPKLQYKGVHISGRSRIQRAEGFVQKKDFRFADDRLRNG